MGGVAKPLLPLAGRTLLAQGGAALAAVGAAPIVAVGPASPEPGVIWLREDPPYGGPVAAIAAALAHPGVAGTERVLLLAGDLVHPDRVVRRLIRAASETSTADPEAGEHAIVFRADDQPQWLAGLYRTASVRQALSALPSAHDASCRALFGGLAIGWILDEDGITADVDTPADWDRACAEADAERDAAHRPETEERP